MSNNDKNTTPAAKHDANAPAPVSNFLRGIIDRDLADGHYTRDGLPNVITRFPPEPNGYLHIGHAKSICLNFGLARDYAGRCHLRFDDTNPEKEDQEYVDTIIDSVKWLGFDWNDSPEQGDGSQHRSHLYYASDYFDTFYAIAEYLINAGHAYVDSQSADDMAANRGDFSKPGVNSPFRDRTAAESLDLFRRMKAGEFQGGEHILRAKIDMASPNMNMRDPAIYRIRHAHHHRTGDKWCIYPMYDYAHPLEDAIENITHSICTLEFQDHRPFYDWIIERAAEGGFFKQPVPRQYEFARLNLTYVVTSKRKLRQLVEQNIVSGWDDPRMPTIVGIRRRGYTPEALQLFCERIGVTRSDGWIDYSTLEGCLREDLDPKAPRATAVLRPLKLIIDNFPMVGEMSENIACSAPVHPHHPERGNREFTISKELWIEQEDFMEVPTKGYFRLFPGNKVRLRYGYVVECTGADKDADGNIIAVHCNYFADSKSGTEGSANYKVKGNIHWVSAADALEAEVRLYDRLFTDANPDAGGKDFMALLNPNALEVVKAYVEPGMKDVTPDTRLQFERHGYFVADRVDSVVGKPVFNRVTTLKDGWGK
ncbi:glutamine--tRNA ligase/YqeY domain fusion protein [Undibacterium sp. RTI2.1]|uniref:glutamine--tRNA ligase/YqeY domain fusion protein n=1 Tax=unclassified Undibacterium TaxID=2630295 RepID=UPI002AB5240B|nr:MULTISPECIES: glutamine--tRNA ligase/YqeY domain fusion protein [unclassified Undibacterium]MDY7538602.1 glutamine--tRNA ligase/YqeY domain fusion protein [Undibacterium sp. 5I1]MEB0031291.1 glutamine--tRNA ligase/YqeY domain fusion protein [Undibacterium sp. RTI2.1]MEB0116317.1 glutamine--tRNA ligase/YqeY domain fusion protein [Undibacterium sp. RTI2.2]MEB0231445.1 glutamine--tRNA ligase/YqeY domain fusion protein [Undibacterium sp. 10I3]MEB0258104.1 glutamine--tRNA ligase/YqeY domain fusi